MKRSTPATLVAVSLLIIAGLLVAGCTTTQQETPGETTLTVFTAASLTGAFTDIGKAYEAENENVKVEFVFDGSQTLRTQIEQGATPDIFVSASTKHIESAPGCWIHGQRHRGSVPREQPWPWLSAITRQDHRRCGPE